ncbi:helicase associated domain-containing protein, partial [Streptomyces sp. Root55]|uniref:helicase associated domain-containing protein n=1 Tax=Streptomyces sp. Root55 TaxID=1736554 RepID=UPI0032B74768
MEHLAEPQSPSRYQPLTTDSDGATAGTEEGRSAGPSAPARELLKFSTPRDPAALAAFINLRILDPEHEHWRRGIEACTLYLREHGDLRVPFTYRAPSPTAQQDAAGVGAAARHQGATGPAHRWPASLAGFPLGQWIADARRQYARDSMTEDRVVQLEKFGMIWSHIDVAWDEGLAAARAWAEQNG